MNSADVVVNLGDEMNEPRYSRNPSFFTRLFNPKFPLQRPEDFWILYPVLGLLLLGLLAMIFVDFFIPDEGDLERSGAVRYAAFVLGILFILFNFIHESLIVTMFPVFPTFSFEVEKLYRVLLLWGVSATVFYMAYVISIFLEAYSAAILWGLLSMLCLMVRAGEFWAFQLLFRKGKCCGLRSAMLSSLHVLLIASTILSQLILTTAF